MAYAPIEQEGPLHLGYMEKVNASAMPNTNPATDDNGRGVQPHKRGKWHLACYTFLSVLAILAMCWHSSYLNWLDMGSPSPAEPFPLESLSTSKPEKVLGISEPSHVKPFPRNSCACMVAVVCSLR